jgi:hypothetical protein
LLKNKKREAASPSSSGSSAANIHAARAGVTLRGRPATNLWLRIPMQILFIAIASGPPAISVELDAFPGVSGSSLFWRRGSASIHHEAIQKDDKKAGSDQGQHDPMIQVIAGSAWACAHREGHNAQQHPAKSYKVGYESPADFLRLPLQNSRRAPQKSESTQRFHNGRGHDARLVQWSDGDASV